MRPDALVEQILEETSTLTLRSMLAATSFGTRRLRRSKRTQRGKKTKKGLGGLFDNTRDYSSFLAPS